ncbi:uncharacterized protein PITG_08856 [Phytophthora infestans T30-4]|uniref:Transmembrane protein n=1 Tax=Phytophthora infestans (strain T30-4) TaxID=403677 RepID=D0NDC5_PHYIT|nr:uncharacterized protein PITG_08856 [Phytophthora infestans T30-4]EEY56082.1 conserved hypothetical protein [Phytophthora infestans T30-4]|eukprot:XP_002902912.1 conserved hypothetical protein [Phytophthora infestans T30-4]
MDELFCANWNAIWLPTVHVLRSSAKERVIIATWYITYTLIQFLSAVLQAVSGLIGLFANSSVLVIFLFFFLFGLSVLCFAFFISTLFSNARTGSFVDFETSGIGANFGNLDTLNVNFRLSTALQMFLFDCVVYTLLGLYFKRVIPKQYGTSLKCRFLRLFGTDVKNPSL